MRWSLVLFVLVTACSRPIAVAVETANAAATLGDISETTIAGAVKRSEAACLALVDAKVVECVTASRARFAPIWKAYDRFRVSWLALEAAIRTAQAVDKLGQMPDVRGVMLAAAKVAETQHALEQAATALGEK